MVENARPGKRRFGATIYELDWVLHSSQREPQWQAARDHRQGSVLALRLCRPRDPVELDNGVAGSMLVRFVVPRLPACIGGGLVACVVCRKVCANHVLSGCFRLAHAGESSRALELNSTSTSAF